MIDYEKLKLAIELCRNSFTYYFLIEFSPIQDSDEINITLMNSASNRGDSMASLDDLIEKLQELIKHEPKYKIGDIVFFRNDIDIHEIRIDDIINDEEILYLYRNENGDYSDNISCFHQFEECDLFPTREALIEYQLEYWVNQLKITPGFEKLTGEFILKDSSSCDHKFDGKFYCINGQEFPANDILRFFVVKCRKCGEFYR
jgi:hypothetical protein